MAVFSLTFIMWAIGTTYIIKSVNFTHKPVKARILFGVLKEVVLHKIRFMKIIFKKCIEVCLATITLHAF